MNKRRIAMAGLVAAVLGTTFLAVTSARATDHVLRTGLDGDNEVCSVATCDDPNGTGRAVVRLYPNAQKVCFSIRWARISSPYGAHIHRGRAGEEGPIVVKLFGARRLSKSVKQIGGCVTGVDQALIADIQAHPRRFYVNVHTPEYEGGAIRGQLHA